MLSLYSPLIRRAAGFVLTALLRPLRLQEVRILSRLHCMCYSFIASNAFETPPETPFNATRPTRCPSKRPKQRIVVARRNALFPADLKTRSLPMQALYRDADLRTTRAQFGATSRPKIKNSRGESVPPNRRSGFQTWFRSERSAKQGRLLRNRSSDELLYRAKGTQIGRFAHFVQISGGFC